MRLRRTPVIGRFFANTNVILGGIFKCRCVGHDIHTEGAVGESAQTGGRRRRNRGKDLQAARIVSLLSRCKWTKAIGPDNTPTDLFKACPAHWAIALALLCTHQILTRIWQCAFIRPIEKPGADLAETPLVSWLDLSTRTPDWIPAKH
jgi:hypothetical protein